MLYVKNVVLNGKQRVLKLSEKRVDCGHCKGTGKQYRCDIPLGMMPGGNFGHTSGEKEEDCTWCQGKGYLVEGDVFYNAVVAVKRESKEDWQRRNEGTPVIDPSVCDRYFPKIGEYYQAICLYNGIIDKLCPNNEDCLCRTKLLERPVNHYHEWDGRNAWKCPCG